MLKKDKKIRVLLVCDSPGHSTGYYVVGKGLREAGVEVILGGFQIPAQIVESAVQEDVDFIGYRIMDGAPEILVPRLMESLEEKSIRDIKVILGGIVPPPVIPGLKEMGIDGIFPPGTKIPDIVEYLEGHM
ncbi:MAG: cobalamin-dependent protein [Thermodesulfobacteriota bacterium]|nr:cobalamin-dependent protein [Thermodesulfobacteriota bacterium]